MNIRIEAKQQMTIKERNEIILEYMDYITITTRKYCRDFRVYNQHDIKDVTQDVFEHIIVRLPAVYDAEKGSLSTWLDRIIRNKVKDCKSYLFRRVHSSYTDERLEIFPQHSPEEAFLHEVVFTDLCNLLDSRECKIFNLLRLDYNYHEIGQILRLKESHVRKITQRAKKTIRQAKKFEEIVTK